MQVVVDTSILLRSDDDPDAAAVLSLLLEGGHLLALDISGRILAEYYRYHDHLWSINSAVGPWLATMLNASVLLDGRLKRPERASLNAVKFDRKDIPFVGTAQKTDSGVVVHHDRGYDRDPPKQMAVAALGVRPMRGPAARAFLTP